MAMFGRKKSRNKVMRSGRRRRSKNRQSCYKNHLAFELLEDRKLLAVLGPGTENIAGNNTYWKAPDYYGPSGGYTFDTGVNSPNSDNGLAVAGVIKWYVNGVYVSQQIVDGHHAPFGEVVLNTFLRDGTTQILGEVSPYYVLGVPVVTSVHSIESKRDAATDVVASRSAAIRD